MNEYTLKKMITAVPTIPRKDSTTTRSFIVYPSTLSSIKENRLLICDKLTTLLGLVI